MLELLAEFQLWLDVVDTLAVASPNDSDEM
jgi:hypothetical protein